MAMSFYVYRLFFTSPYCDQIECRTTKNQEEREREGGEGASIYTNGKICSKVEELKIVVNKRTNK